MRRNRIASNKSSFIEVLRSERIMRSAENSLSTLTCVDGKAATVYATFCKMARYHKIASMTVTFDDLSMFSMSVNALLKSILNSQSGDELLVASSM